MLRVFILFMSIVPFTALYANNNVSEALNQFAWEKRQLIVFSDDITHPQYQLFLKTKTEFQEEFDDRKLHVWHIINGQKPKLESQLQDGLNNNDFHSTFNVNKDEFKILLIGYDQGVKLRQDEVQIDTLFGEIDQMPIRMQEMAEEGK